MQALTFFQKSTNLTSREAKGLTSILSHFRDLKAFKKKIEKELPRTKY